jgi:hypothetical protein
MPPDAAIMAWQRDHGLCVQGPNLNVCNFDQTHSPASRYTDSAIRVGVLPMYTSAECRAQAKEKLAQAERDDQHRNRLVTAAEAWLFLANQLRRHEAALVPKKALKKTYGQTTKKNSPVKKAKGRDAGF